MKTLYKRGLVIALIASSAPLCHAAQASADTLTPDNEIRLGLYSIFYDASAQDISGPYVPAGLNLHVKNVETV